MVEKVREPLARLCYRRNFDGVWEPFTTDVTVGLPVGLVRIFDSNIGCGSTGVAYSPAFYIAQCGYFGLWLQCSVVGAGVIAVSITYQQSFDLTPANFVAPEDAGTTLAIADANIHIISIPPTPMPYLRILATGTGANDATTMITGYLFAQ